MQRTWGLAGLTVVRVCLAWGGPRVLCAVCIDASYFPLDTLRNHEYPEPTIDPHVIANKYCTSQHYHCQSWNISRLLNTVPFNR